MTPHLNRLNETVLMIGHKIYFYGFYGKNEENNSQSNMKYSPFQKFDLDLQMVLEVKFSFLFRVTFVPALL